jgi:hypothetical protein
MARPVNGGANEGVVFRRRSSLGHRSCLNAMSSRRTAFMRWIDGELKANKGLAQRVEALVNEMKIKQRLQKLEDEEDLRSIRAARAELKVKGTIA